jgi:hypothetical protein
MAGCPFCNVTDSHTHDFGGVITTYPGKAATMHPMAEKENAEQFEKEEADRRGDLVFEAIGTASMCWKDRPSGEFDSVQAEKIGQWLLAAIAKETDLTLADWLTNDPPGAVICGCGQDLVPPGEHCLHCGRPADG